MSNRIVITGATGFIGSALCKKLVKDNYEVIALTRGLTKAREILGNDVKIIEWDGQTTSDWVSYLEDAAAIVNLAGENIGASIWTHKKKKDIRDSRINSGQTISEAIKQLQKKPKVVIQASAIGYYGPCNDEIIDEASPNGKGFLAGVAKEWENSTKEIEDLGVRRIVIRTGVVLALHGGALPSIMKTFRMFLGGPLGSGKHWFSWIHIDDEIESIYFLIKTETLSGVFNLTAPDPLTMKEFCHVLGNSMQKPASISVPGFAIRFLLGEMADEMLLSGQKVIPQKLLASGYKFLYPNAEQALKAILKSNV